MTSERARFEAWIFAAPYDRDVTRFTSVVRSHNTTVTVGFGERRLPRSKHGGTSRHFWMERTDMVRAKFKVTSITRSQGWGSVKEIQTIKLSPVCDGSEENKKFYAASPSGAIELGTVNAEAAAEFDLGAEFYVDFTPAA